MLADVPPFGHEVIRGHRGAAPHKGEYEERKVHDNAGIREPRHVVRWEAPEQQGDNIYFPNNLVRAHVVAPEQGEQLKEPEEERGGGKCHVEVKQHCRVIHEHSKAIPPHERLVVPVQARGAPPVHMDDKEYVVG